MAADTLPKVSSWSTVPGSNFPNGSTAVGGNLDDNLQTIQAAVRQMCAAAAVVAAGALLDLDLTSAFYLNATTATPATAITSLGTMDAGVYRWITFGGAYTLAHSANLGLPGSANITTANNDCALFVSSGAGVWRCKAYFKADGTPLIFNPVLLLGTAAAPAISFTADSNTGMYSPGADQVGFSTGGTVRMTIANAGVTINGVSITAAGGFVGPVTGNLSGNSNGLHTGNVAGCTSIAGTGTLGMTGYSTGYDLSGQNNGDNAISFRLSASAGLNVAVSGATLSAEYGNWVALTYQGDVSGCSVMASDNGVVARKASAGSGSAVLLVDTNVGGSTFDLIRARTGVSTTPDIEFKVRGDGSVFSDGGTSMTTPADYAEMFEWADGNPDGEDRVGRSVALVGNQIRIAAPGDDPIGIVSGNPAVLGDAGSLRWVEKYLRDEFNRPIYENYEVLSWDEEMLVTPEVPAIDARDAVLDADDEVLVPAVEAVPAVPAVYRTITHTYAADALPEGVVPPAGHLRTTMKRRKLNPLHDAAAVYVPRIERPEWSPVGLVGKLRAHVGEQINPRWIKLRDIAPGIEEYLVR